jgi:hypothetical protein
MEEWILSFIVTKPYSPIAQVTDAGQRLGSLFSDDRRMRGYVVNSSAHRPMVFCLQRERDEFLLERITFRWLADLQS